MFCGQCKIAAVIVQNGNVTPQSLLGRPSMIPTPNQAMKLGSEAIWWNLLMPVDKWITSFLYTF